MNGDQQGDGQFSGHLVKSTPKEGMRQKINLNKPVSTWEGIHSKRQRTKWEGEIRKHLFISEA
jgi:hypothetical protein